MHWHDIKFFFFKLFIYRHSNRTHVPTISRISIVLVSTIQHLYVCASMDFNDCCQAMEYLLQIDFNFWSFYVSFLLSIYLHVIELHLKKILTLLRVKVCTANSLHRKVSYMKRTTEYLITIH